ncbi:NADPH:quinone reductase [Variovorax ginsengisoli]|uniref:NADPH:quinone reductase n=1 Tax=Variovorax ginsengisoli TaxID=363844 RepID=A0ABT8SGF4_9BURK|nr:NADPH:quinone reductase [Variovorax ginsengisoli]MDN8618102.1 NADPH:quinone reductase [Variovorax ginsengisoli]MDO1537272.1 NADPH:quinone reductase [Variovorax ginsengisoli]
MKPTPTPAPGEVLVRLQALGVNPSDVKARAGLRGGKSAMAYPQIIPHSDGAGVVAGLGSRSSRFATGDRVWIANAQWHRACGTAAEFISINEALVFPLPANVPFEVGAALGIPALTACHAVTGYGPVDSKVVFVSGGGGTVGSLAVQIAKQSGAFVVASGRGADKVRVLRLGADAFVDYTSEHLVDEVLRATNGRRLEHVVEVEFGTNIPAVSELVSERSVIVAYGSSRNQQPPLPFYALMFKGVRLEFLLVYLLTPQERHAAARRINEMLTRGALEVPVANILPLEACAQAHEIVETEKRTGAVVLQTKEP